MPLLPRLIYDSFGSAVNATAGRPCIIERVEYSAISDFSDRQAMTTINRDNCIKPGLYCNPTLLVCQQVNALGVACSQDTMCLSVSCNLFYPHERPRTQVKLPSHFPQLNCGPKGICIAPPEDPTPLSPLAVSLTFYFISRGLALTDLCP